MMKDSVEAQEYTEKLLENPGRREKESDDAPPPKSLTREHMAPRSPLSLLVSALSYVDWPYEVFFPLPIA